MKDLRRRGLALALAATLIFSFAASADTFLFDYNGFDWVEWGDLGDVGTCYTAMGCVVSHNATFLTLDYVANEYTFVIDYTCHISSAGPFGPNEIYTYAPVPIDVYCDSKTTGTLKDYNSGPVVWPAITSTFTDGEKILGGDTQNVIFVVNTSTGNGNMQTIIDWNEGTQLAGIPVESRTMSMSLNGLTHDGAGVIVPPGYDWQIDGQVFIQDPVPVERTSWGNLKNTFAEGD